MKNNSFINTLNFVFTRIILSALASLLTVLFISVVCTVLEPRPLIQCSTVNFYEPNDSVGVDPDRLRLYLCMINEKYMLTPYKNIISLASNVRRVEMDSERNIYILFNNDELYVSKYENKKYSELTFLKENVVNMKKNEQNDYKFITRESTEYKKYYILKQLDNFRLNIAQKLLNQGT